MHLLQERVMQGMRSLIVCLGIAWAGVALAAPRGAGPPARVSAAAQYKIAVTQYGNGNYQEALESIEQGLGVAPRDLKLLGLKGTVLLELRDYPRALATYQAYLKAGVDGANRRRNERHPTDLGPVRVILQATPRNDDDRNQCG